MTARHLAVERLLRVEHEGAHVSRLSSLSDGVSAPVARAASDYVAGVTRQRRYLDFLLGTVVRRPLGDLDAPLLQALRIGTYDLVVRQRPPHAAVGEAVGVVRDVLHRGAAGVANASLRALARHLGAGTLPEPTGPTPASRLAVRYSFPTWMVRRWVDVFGEDAARDFLVASNRTPRYGLRLRGGAEARDDALEELRAIGADAEPSLWQADMVTVGRLQPVLRGGWLDGRAAVQDEAAALVVDVVDVRPGMQVLDAASAPGGKAVGLALAGAQVTALDVSDAKARLVQRAADAAEVKLQPVVGRLQTAALAGPFDAVLLDAPCSGTGVLAKRADLRWNRSPDDLQDLAALQAELLDAAAAHVAPGGVLVYSTCSVEPEENDHQVDAFLDRRPHFSLEPVGDRVPAAMRDGAVYRALPHLHGTDGAFAARLRRTP